MSVSPLLVLGSKPYKELELIWNAKSLLKDIGKMSPGEQTSGLEAYHKVVIFFASKSVHYPFATMEARYSISGASISQRN